jgi:hypothetical protein
MTCDAETDTRVGEIILFQLWRQDDENKLECPLPSSAQGEVNDGDDPPVASVNDRREVEVSRRMEIFVRVREDNIIAFSTPPVVVSPALSCVAFLVRLLLCRQDSNGSVVKRTAIPSS